MKPVKPGMAYATNRFRCFCAFSVDEYAAKMKSEVVYATASQKIQSFLTLHSVTLCGDFGRLITMN